MLTKPKTYLVITGAIIFLSAFLDLGNYWEYISHLENAICWEITYCLLVWWYIKDTGKDELLKWYNFLTTTLASIILAQGFLDILYQLQALPIRIAKGEMYHGDDRWLYYSESAKAINEIQPLYIVSYQFTLLLYTVFIFIFIVCSGWITKNRIKQ